MVSSASNIVLLPIFVTLMKFDFKDIEARWKQVWVETGLNKVNIDKEKPKFYVLDMFPYPSGAGLHVGHPLGYVASDIYSRYKRMTGFNVLHPMGYDAFGLPAEQYALDTGVHPADSTSANIKRYRSQLDNIGFSYDWSRQVRTDDPSYYKWTQWIFLQLYNHYYDTGLNKAVPVKELVERFGKSGSANLQAASSKYNEFTAEEWKAMTTAQQHSILMNFRLAFRTVGYVNWCEALGTVLANDEVKDGVSERGGFPVVQKEMLQWSLRITAYAERLLSGLDNLDWNDSIKSIQKNWIGKSTGASIRFQVSDMDDTSIEVFTTRPDTIFGSTFIVLAPDHDLAPSLTSENQKEIVDAFIKQFLNSGSSDKSSQKDSSGVWTGSYAIHPITKKQIPIWLGDYVLKAYGTGAIMAVPSDDSRDRAFATKYDLPIIEVIDRSQYPGSEIGDKQGILQNSDFLNGFQVAEAIHKMNDYLVTNNLGNAKTEYKLRDANFSRQRYWGEPFPVYYTTDGVDHGVDENDLPVVLPDLDDFKPSPDGRSPLARLDEWVHFEEGKSRETDTMPGYAGSSWYYLRYMDPHSDKALASPEALAYWKEVDLYVGGVEHAVGHLMYARFWHKFLYDLGYLPTEEPFKKLINQGMIQGVIEYLFLKKEKVNDIPWFYSADVVESKKIPRGELALIPVHIDFVSNYGQTTSYLDAEGIRSFLIWRNEYENAAFECSDKVYYSEDLEGAKMQTLSEVGKMSKRYHNVVNPDDVIATYGADCFRMYEMFLGPIEQSKPWDTLGIEGINKFIRKVWSLFYNEQEEWVVDDSEPTPETNRIIHATIKKVGEDIERFSFNTAISQMMICVNEFRKQQVQSRSVLQTYLRILAPFAPFITEELWKQCGNSTSIHLESFPTYDAKWLETTSIIYPVCINGKKRAEVELDKGLSNQEIEASAKALPEIQKWLDGQAIKKVIIVKDKMVNLVI